MAPMPSGNKRNNGPSRANTTGTSGTSFQDRMKERDRERQVRERDERDAAARAIREDPKLSSVLDSSAATTTAAAAAAAATTAQSTGTNLWNRFLAAKDVITGEERWPDSDDSDHEGESHVSRVLREYADKKEARELAARIEELERMPITPAPSSLTASGSSGSTYSGRSRTLREAIRHDNTSPTSPAPAPAAAPTSLASPASSSDYYGRSLRARGEAGHQASRSEDTSHRPPIRTREIGHRPAGALSPPTSPDTATPSPSTSTSNSSATLETPRIGNRFRTSSDASLSMALGRLEGKRNQDALVAQVSHLGSTRARSPHRGNRAYREHIDVAPPPPLPTPKSDYRQQRQPLSPSSSSASLRCQNSSSRRNGALAQQQQQQQPVDHGLDDYGQRLQQLQQQEQQQQQTQQARYF
ncbi:hypothetical protein BGX29_010375 [Mortierella sp. GBA35]|nr:hypothetical protein BGX29_010375 [Mortierella sp. GBA35]